MEDRDDAWHGPAFRQVGPMIRSRIFAVFAFVTFVTFCAIILAFVPRLDLAVAMLIGIVPAGYDIWDQLFRRRPPKSPG